ncbi:GGDEF domain-containing protein [Malaciobacter pacificus]|uniref:diguanylate cyclase n=1 Tax=Malaciobacter pacificus TaxID=1080223 RepID=A0A5C2H6I9_9BACT|nr:diguanylate cyclase [Malaciobacter pacificus]QEP33899.1 diguanylate cyclase [Malaciobacter pacificus]GGD34631.1 GGDEF domain-containing protein [Malaciobacter pacificus]
MSDNIKSFKEVLSSEIVYIKEQFLSRYIASFRKIEEEEYVNIKDFFCDIIEDICNGNLEKSFITCEKLVELNIKLSIPYVTLTNELINLEKLIMERLLYKNAKDEIYEIYKLHLELEDTIAKIYLDKYTESLISKNNIRLSSLNDIYERNVVLYYKAHLEWLNELSKAVKSRDIAIIPETNHTLCTFGKWLHSDGKKIIQNNSKYNSILKMHEKLHFMSKQIMSYLSKDSGQNHILLTYLEKSEMLSLSLGTELALIDNTLINNEAKKDPLTGALNRQRIEKLYQNQLEIASATAETFVLAMCDLDYFKNVNDSYGHMVGDKMLKAFVQIAKKSLRSSDMIIRYGGEEFVFILPAVNAKKAKEILNKIREDFQSFSIDYEDKKVSTTISIGFIQINSENGESYFKNFEDALIIADRKLYEAKNSGRNRVC